MKNRTALVAFLALAAVSVAGGEAPQATARAADAPQSDALFESRIAPFLKTYCTECHGGDEPKGDLSLESYRDAASVAKDPENWERVLEMLQLEEMPPEDEKQPSKVERQRIVDWIAAHVPTVDCSGQAYPGRVTIRRLNRREYNNTIRDLVGVDFRPADDFPADNIGDGFDNVGDALTLPPILLEKYLAAAEEIVSQALTQPKTRDTIIFFRPDEELSRDECAQRILKRFMRRAYRRPVTDEEIDRLVALGHTAEQADNDFDEDVGLALQVVLVSPHFLFRIEPDPPGGASQDRPLNDFELATRLSYFLWSTMPDEELFRLAEQGKLHDEGAIESQVRRMLDDPKSAALVENFAGQWLQLRGLAKLSPDPERFPDFDESLRSAMRKETELFFEAIMKEDRSVLDFLDADFTFINERLARHYGIEGIRGEDFRRVDLSGNRGGVLTHASILALTSNPTRTSPVKRGKWILDNILGSPPSPPPAGVEELAEGDDAELLGSLRERMEQHRSNPECAVCHNQMDALGFSFENFDAVGAWRDRDGKFAIDPSGTLPGGLSFDGVASLRAILKEEKREEFTRCLTKKMLTYAIGLGLEPYDQCAENEIVERLRENDYKFSSLILGVTKSVPFRMRGANQEGQ